MSARQAGLDRAPGVQSALGFDVGSVGCFGGVEHAEAGSRAICQDARSPSILVARDAEQPARFVSSVRGSLILRVRSSISESEVAKPVVSSDAVDVVDFKRRKRSVVECPHSPVLKDGYAIYTKPAITEGRRASGSNAGRKILARLPYPVEKASFRFVVQQFPQTLCGKIKSSHDALLMLIGQRPAGTSMPSGLRYSNALGV